MLRFFKKSDKKRKKQKPVLFICKGCGHDCSKCDTPFCYVCYSKSGVCPKCGYDEQKLDKG